MKETIKTQVEAQNDHAKFLEKKHPHGFPLISGKEFIKSMRHSGYKSTGSAINELIDNSIEADATFVFTHFLEKDGKISDIFIIDNGHGMNESSLKTAVMWGGTHRHKDNPEAKNDFLGAYGFGCGTSLLFLTEEYEIYSKRKDADWISLGINFSEITNNPDLLIKDTGILSVPSPKTKSLPKEVIKYLETQADPQTGNKINLTNGTVIHIKNPLGYNGLTQGYKQVQTFTKNLRKNFCVTYRPELMKNGPQLKINNLFISHIDPLFITENTPFYKDRGMQTKDQLEKDILSKYTENYNKTLLKTPEGLEKLFEQGILAKDHGNIEFEMQNTLTKRWGKVRIRFSFMHPRFARNINKKTGALIETKHASSPDIEETDGFGRWQLMHEVNRSLFTVCRANRMIDTVTKINWSEKKESVNKGCS